MGLKIGIIIIPWYGLFIVLGISIGMLMGYCLIRYTNLKYDDFIQVVCFVGLGAVIGAKLLYLIVKWRYIIF